MDWNKGGIDLWLRTQMLLKRKREREWVLKGSAAGASHQLLTAGGVPGHL